MDRITKIVIVLFIGVFLLSWVTKRMKNVENSSTSSTKSNEFSFEKIASSITSLFSAVFGLGLIGALCYFGGRYGIAALLILIIYGLIQELFQELTDLLPEEFDQIFQFEA